MNTISTRGETRDICFSDAVMMGLARDGGLLLPEAIPSVVDRLGEWRRLSYADLAFEVIRLYADLPDADLRALIHTCYGTFRHDEITPVVTVGDLHVLELFHGPTLAFKDIALQFLGNLYEWLLRDGRRELNILGATSGDTGSAAIHGVRGRKHIRIFMLYPDGRVSPTQERQMTSVPDANVFCLAVEGTFDDCQAVVKSLFSDLAFRDRLSLGSVNSINWARLVAQVVYYFYGAFRVCEATGAEHVTVSVPTGNFGDIFAGYLACRMGAPIQRLLLATNENDILARFFRTGEYSRGDVRETYSPSMDIQVASNFERYLYYRVGEDPAALRSLLGTFSETGRMRLDGPVEDPLFRAGSCSNEDTLATIRDVHDACGYLLDPHTAVGVHVARQFREDATPMLCLATAHPSKFAEAITRATGSELAHHPVIDALDGLPTRSAPLRASASEVKAYIESHV